MGETEKKYRGVDIKTETYHCGEDVWKLNPEGHLPKYTEKIEKAVGTFDGLTEKLRTGKLKDKEAQKEAQAVTKTILEVGLLPKGVGNPNGFDFDTALNKYGWRTLDNIAIDLKRLFLEVGGVEELRLSNQRLAEVKRDGYVTIEV